jgi:hypothetical protein|nr:hypothetical protein Q903MT_gene1260 [Picea sitchensis]
MNRIRGKVQWAIDLVELAKSVKKPIIKGNNPLLHESLNVRVEPRLFQARDAPELLHGVGQQSMYILARTKADIEKASERPEVHSLNEKKARGGPRWLSLVAVSVSGSISGIASDRSSSV